MRISYKKVITAVLTVVFLLAIPIYKLVDNAPLLDWRVNAVMTDLQAFSSEGMVGRNIGGAGQKAFETYVEGSLNREGIPFEKTEIPYLMPEWKPSDGLVLETGERLIEGRDLTVSADGISCGLHYKGDILFAGVDFFKMPKSLMKGRVVCIQVNRLSEDYVKAALDAGVKGILFYSFGEVGVNGLQVPSDYRDQSLAYKTGSQLFTAALGPKAYLAIQREAAAHAIPEFKHETLALGGFNDKPVVGWVPRVKANFILNYKAAKVPSYTITFKGKESSKSLVFVSRWEGRGLNAGTGKLYPAVQESAVPTAALLELARSMKRMVVKEMPAYDVTIVLLGGLNVHPRAADQVAKRLCTQYDGAEVFLLEGLGDKKATGLLFNWDRYSALSRVFAANLFNQMRDYPVQAATGGEGATVDFSHYSSFSRPNTGVVTVTAINEKGNLENVNGRPADNLDQISEESVSLLKPFFKMSIERLVYASKPFTFIKTNQLMGIGLLMAVIFILGLIEDYLKALPGEHSRKRIHRHPLWRGIQWVSSSLPALFITLFIVGLILSLPQDFNSVRLGRAQFVSASGYDIFEDSWKGFMALLGTVKSPDPAMFGEIFIYLKRSLILAAAGLFISMGLGLIKGVTDAWLSKGRGSVGSIFGIMLYAIPDVLIAFVGLVSVVYFSKIPWLMAVVDADTLRIYVMPVIALSIVPMLYMGRLVTVALEEEVQKDYVHYLYYKGMSRTQIYWKHFLKVGLTKILMSSKAVVMLLFSNLLIVEYLFNYPGVMTNILDSAGQPVKIILLSLSLGLSFGLFQLLCQVLGKRLSPGRDA